jgi:phenylacetic acid degradation protein paaN
MFYQKHKSVLDDAIMACEKRHYWSPFVESPSRHLHPEGAHEAGKMAFERQLNTSFELNQPGEIGRTGFEVSPYTQQPLGVDYPKSDTEQIVMASKKAGQSWRKICAEERAGICLEMAFALEKQCFENAYATMHTAGQAFLMAYSGSGPNALDRGVEAIAYALKAMRDVPNSASWTKPFGKAGPVSLSKSYRLIPRGIAAVICCATFPMWNAYPAIFANLATGNSAIVKPHPNGILPVAIAIRTMRKVLSDNGYDPNILIMTADTREHPVTIELLQHPEIPIIDYTGSQSFGIWIEENCSQKLVYTETAGCNGVVIESTENIDGLINALANGLCGFSAQMCTSPQNIHIPEHGFETNVGKISFDGFKDLLVDAINERVADPKRAAGLCGAIQADESLAILDQLRNEDKASIALDSFPYDHPEFPFARTASPLVLTVKPELREIYNKEHFAPVAFLIREKDAESALANATSLVRESGAISSYLYSSNKAYMEKAKDVFADAGASLWCNMTTPMPMNFAAAYSDYHVTGLNSSGNACLADLAFVADRFRIVQFREPLLS